MMTNIDNPLTGNELKSKLKDIGVFMTQILFGTQVKPDLLVFITKGIVDNYNEAQKLVFNAPIITYMTNDMPV